MNSINLIANVCRDAGHTGWPPPESLLSPAVEPGDHALWASLIPALVARVPSLRSHSP